MSAENMGPFRADGRRRSPEEIQKKVAKELGVVPLVGFEKLVSCSGGVKENHGFVAGFMEAHGARSWSLPLEEGESIVWETAPVPQDLPSVSEVVFLFSMGMGNGSPLPQPSGEFELSLNGERQLSFRVVKYGENWEGPGNTRLRFEVKRLESCPPGQTLALDDVIREESFAAFGVGALKVPFSLLRVGERARIRVSARSRVTSKRWFKLDNSDDVLSKANIYTGLRVLVNGEERLKVGDYGVYFGDLHTHSGDGSEGFGRCGVGTIDENYRYARDVSNLDLYALTDHDWQTDEKYWRRCMDKVEEYDRPGEFVTLPAFEWTSSMYGHRNVYYREPVDAFFDARRTPRGRDSDYWETEVDDPEDLWSKLDELPTEAITIPHHPKASSHPLTWDFFNPRYDRLAEIYSSWGTHEYENNPYRGSGSDHYSHLYLREALDRGLRFGFLASSDGHDGHPGNAQSPESKHHHIYHHLGSGRVGVLAEELTRSAVFEALYERRCYATTGPPIIIDFRLGGRMMGGELKREDVGSSYRLRYSVTVPAFLERVDLIRDGAVVKSHSFVERKSCFKVEHLEEVDEENSTYYYVRVIQSDGEMAWSSPIFIN